MTYFARVDILTHENFTLSSKFWGVVIHIFDFDIDSYFRILVMAAWHDKTNQRDTNEFVLAYSVALVVIILNLSVYERLFRRDWNAVDFFFNFDSLLKLSAFINARYYASKRMCVSPNKRTFSTWSSRREFQMLEIIKERSEKGKCIRCWIQAHTNCTWRRSETHRNKYLTF